MALLEVFRMSASKQSVVLRAGYEDHGSASAAAALSLGDEPSEKNEGWRSSYLVNSLADNARIC